MNILGTGFGTSNENPGGGFGDLSYGSRSGFAVRTYYRRLPAPGLSLAHNGTGRAEPVGGGVSVDMRGAHIYERTGVLEGDAPGDEPAQQTERRLLGAWYTGPDWTNGSGTAVNAANLNAIITALEQASITSVTSLPGSPFNEQEVYYAADATNGVYWHLRYRSASGSTHKWEALGAVAPLTAEVLTSQTTSSATYVDLATAGPTVTVPLAGDYLITFGATLYNSTGTNPVTMVAPKLGQRPRRMMMRRTTRRPPPPM